MDLFENDVPGRNEPEFSVSEISGEVKRLIEGKFDRVRVKGEVGRCARPRSGHFYFDLKDERSTLAAVIWKGDVPGLEVIPEEGMEVVASGRLTTYAGQSKYQMIVDNVSPAGLGALMAMLEKRKEKLRAEGLFDPERRKPLPYLPGIIGVVTSPTGAVISDILHRLRDRFPREVLVWPTRVQGKGAAEEVAAAIRGFNALSPGGEVPRPDVLIVARGGGSIEDLWTFNEEIVARAAAESDIPLISAVGHETDTTLIDHVSDFRAPTPTAAAERVVPVRIELLAKTENLGARMFNAVSDGVKWRKQRRADISRALPRAETLTAGPRQRLDVVGERLPDALVRRAQRGRLALAEVRGRLSPELLNGLLRQARHGVERGAARLGPALGRRAADARLRADRLTARLRPGDAERGLREKRRELGLLRRRADEAVSRARAARTDQLLALDRLRETLGYKATLGRGYAVAWSGSKVVTSKSEAEGLAALEIEFIDGRMKVDRGSSARKPRSPSSK